MLIKKFPNVVGCDLHRAKCMIAFALPHANISYKVVPYISNRKLSTIQRYPNQVVLYYDAKFDAVAITPTLYYSPDWHEREEDSYST